MTTIRQLPKEVFISIISLLHNSDRLECLCVNRLWHKIISYDILYETISFNQNLEKFGSHIEQAKTFFQNNQELAQRVRHIEIREYQFGLVSSTVSDLPKLFPKLTRLVWIERQRVSGKFERQYSFILDKEEPSKWKKLTSIKTTHFNYALVIKKLIHFANISELSISFKDRMLSIKEPFDFTSMNTLPHYAKTFLKDVEHMSGLVKLTISDAILDLEDMELVHDSCPKLQSLSLENICVNCKATVEDMKLNGKAGLHLFNEGGEKKIAQTPAKNLTSLSLCFYTASNSPQHRIERSKGSLIKWLTYIACKYTNLNKLSLDASVYDGDELLPVISMFEQPLVDIITKTTVPTSYAISGLYPLTKNLMKAIDDQNCKLSKTFLQMGQIKDIEDYTNIIQSSKQMENIRELTIGTSGMMHLDQKTFKSFLLITCCQLSNLVDVTFEANTHQNVLVDILQNLPMLQKLQFRFFQIGIDNLSMVAVKKCKIRELSLGVYSNERDNYDKVNIALKFSLQSCPLLENFSLSGAIFCGPGLLNLDLLDHTRLESVTINVDGIDYYTFSHQGHSKKPKDCKWIDQENLLKEPRIGYVEQNSHLDIAHEGKRILFDLKICSN